MFHVEHFAYKRSTWNTSTINGWNIDASMLEEGSLLTPWQAFALSPEYSDVWG
jgi:hypothetical protein